MECGTIHKTKRYGVLSVILYSNASLVRVRFAGTGYETTTQSSHIRRGVVKDKLCPSVFGVGFIGIGAHNVSVKGKPTKAYSLWCGMLQRCYDVSLHKRSPTYANCSVCDEWHNFQNFASWCEVSFINGYHLDKDIRIAGNRVYSPSSCKFVSRSENNEEAHAKRYIATSPSGVIHYIYNMAEFCRNKGLRSNCMNGVVKGRSLHHKGWACVASKPSQQSN